MKDDEGVVREFSGGEVRFWIEQEAIHLKAVSPENHPSGDPVELTGAEAKRLAVALLEAAKKLDENR